MQNTFNLISKWIDEKIIKDIVIWVVADRIDLFCGPKPKTVLLTKVFLYLNLRKKKKLCYIALELDHRRKGHEIKCRQKIYIIDKFILIMLWNIKFHSKRRSWQIIIFSPKFLYMIQSYNSKQYRISLCSTRICQTSSSKLIKIILW